MSRILRKTLQVGLAVGVLAVIAAFGLRLLVLRSLPSLDGEIPVSGLQNPATIQRDSVGAVTVVAANREDLAFATGYAHGQDRFFQMDLTRRSAAGELSELFGDVALALDRKKRWHRFRARAERYFEQAPRSDQWLLEKYAEGVNAGLSSLKSKPFEYFVLNSEPVAWRPEDSMLVAYAMFMTLNDERAASDIGRGLARNVLPEDVYRWIYPDGTTWDAPMQGMAVAETDIPGATSIDYSSAARVAWNSGLYSDDPVVGSNNWAVAGSRTASGRALVANDMHLSIAVPGTFYRARLVIDGKIDVSGLSLPGTPLIVAGSNGAVAWGFTNSYGDWTDAILLEPGPGGSGYMTAEGVREFDVYEETIAVRNGNAETLTIRETIWGPVQDDGSYPDNEIAVHWSAHDVEAINLNHVQLESVKTVDDALRIASTMGMPPQNFVCGDADGNIGWTIAGRIPRRSDVDGRLPINWQNATTGWLPSEEYPRIVNPESGRIWTANTRVVDGEDLKKIGYGDYALGARAAQIRDDLFSRETFEPEDMLAIQIDDRALFLERWRDLLLRELESQASEDPQVQQYTTLVRNWIPRASVDSVGYRLVQGFRLQLRALVFDMLMVPVRQRYGQDAALHLDRQFEGPLWQLLRERPAHFLGPQYTDWHSLIMSAVNLQIEKLTTGYKDGLENRSWGELNTAAIRHPLSRAIPVLSNWLDMPAEPLSGDTHMPKALGPAFGASERFAVSPGAEELAFLHIPAGQSGHPMSEFYRAGHDDWVLALPTPFLPGPSAHTLRLIPAKH